MNDNVYYNESGITLRKHMTKTFVWVFLGLLVSAVMSFLTIYSGLFYYVYSSNLVYFGLVIAQLASVMYLSSRIYQMSYSSAVISYFIYSILTGISLSSILIVYTGDVIIIAFALAALMFLSLAVIGNRTKVNMDNYSGLLVGGLFALLIASLVGMFFNFSGFQLMICYIGIGLFMAITVWDTQKMKKYYYYYQGDEEMLTKLSIYSALQLYLDFINIFLYIIRIIGNDRRRN